MTDHQVVEDRQGDWSYWKLYTGPVPNGLDFLILEVLPQVQGSSGVERWFFVRFADRAGTHMRLRVRGPSRPERAIERLCGDALRRLPSAPPLLYRPAIGGFDERLDRHAVIRLSTDTYEPELSKYGVRGIEFAEELAQCSSELALETIQLEADGKLTRKDLALCLMSAVPGHFLPEVTVASFWDRYVEYWLQRCGVDSETWRRRFEDKADRLLAAGIDLRASAAGFGPAASALVDRWARALRRCASRYAEHTPPEVPPVVLAMSFAHLMNNRLGLLPLEDAYYGVLLRAGRST